MILEEVLFSLHADGLHEVERVLDVIHRRVAHRLERLIADEFDILDHQATVHADEFYGQTLSDEGGL